MNDNKVKAINGSRSRNTLIMVLKELQDRHCISFCTTDFRCGYSGMSSDQFFSPFYIETNAGKGWIVFASNSIRNDRMCIQQWNAEHIKRIKSNVERAIIVVPDDTRANERERREVEKYQEKIHSEDYYSAIDDVLFQSDLESYISENS